MVALLAILASTLVVAGAPTATAHTQPYCGIWWGSLAKSSPEGTRAPVVGVRVGRHACFDRLVIDLGAKPAPGYWVGYTDRFATSGKGEPVSVAGGAILMVNARAPGYVNGQATVPWRAGAHIVTPEQFSSGGFRTFRDLAYGGSFEGETDFGLGVRARLPFRVFQLDGPGGGSRLVIDVAHRW
ncbi:MAG: hypothetical protein KY452_05815 [Actinobacteria bacterium]|nr:hypothetical protein [Actinomycetota bacterium]